MRERERERDRERDREGDRERGDRYRVLKINSSSGKICSHMDNYRLAYLLVGITTPCKQTIPDNGAVNCYKGVADRIPKTYLLSVLCERGIWEN